MAAPGMIYSILDTNVLVRLLVGDNAIQHAQAERWVKEAESGDRKIVVTPIVIAETSFVLESFYRQARDKIADALEIFVSQRWLQTEEREVLLGIWQYYRQGLHFVDSYLRSWVDVNGGTILSFDKALNKL